MFSVTLVIETVWCSSISITTRFRNDSGSLQLINTQIKHSFSFALPLVISSSTHFPLWWLLLIAETLRMCSAETLWISKHWDWITGLQREKERSINIHDYYDQHRVMPSHYHSAVLENEKYLVQGIRTYPIEKGVPPTDSCDKLVVFGEILVQTIRVTTEEKGPERLRFRGFFHFTF